MESDAFVPEVEALTGLAVVPDALWIAVGARVDDVAPGRGVEVLRGAAATLHAGLVALHPGARLVPGRLALSGGAGDKTSRADDGTVGLDGRVTLPLAPDADLWARAALAARAVEALREAARALSRGKPPVRLAWRPPTPRVTDAEAHHAALATRWHARWRALTAEAVAPVPAGWEPPTEVAQVAVSLMEVRLVLARTRTA